ncbi:MAG: septum formation initiator family protein [Clostridia bacterium]|nr:septum formation initiator family protein [Clostridia bacterium]
MSDKMKRAQYSKAPDTEDWWGDFDPSMPPPPLPGANAAKKKGMSLASQAMMLLACAVFLVCVCAQIFRISLISQQNKQIQELREQIEELSSEQQNLEVRLSLQMNMERIEDEALNRLGMIYPGEDQVRVIAIANTNDSVVTANAAAEEGGQ